MAKLDLTVDVDVKGEGKLRSLGSSLSSGAAALASVGAAAGAAFVGVGAVAANFASDLNESLSKVNVVFGDSADEITRWSEDAATALGTSQQKALEAAGTFGNLFSAMEISADPAADMSQSLVELAADLASFNNVSPEDALLALRSGLVGEAEPLRRFGVQLSAARIEAKAMELGLADANGELDAAAKAQAAYAIIMEDTSLAQGDFERTSDGMANQQRILAATFEDSMAKIGQAFVPIIQEMLPGITAALQTFADWVVANMPAIKSTAETVFGAIGTAIQFLITNVIPVLTQAFLFVSQNVFPIVSQAIAGITSAFQAVLGWVQVNGPAISSIISQVFGAISNIIRSVWPVIESVASVLFPIVSTAAGVLVSALDLAFQIIGNIFEEGGKIFETFAKVWGALFEGIAEIATTVWDTIEDAVKGGINFIVDVINSLIGALNSISIGIPEVGIPGTDIKIGGGYFDPFNLPTIPHLAVGGIVTAPTLALIGESGPEAVIPLDKMGAGGVTIEVNVLGDLRAEDPDEVAAAIGRVLWSQGITDTMLAGAD